MRRAQRASATAPRAASTGTTATSDCKAYNDFRELLARKDIDAVHVATPDHWHAIVVIEACRHGKDVYCQKPETRTLREGPLMVAAARRYGRVVSGGSQRVLEDYRGVVDQCWGGELGTIKSINVNVGPLSQPCNLPAEPVPAGHGLGHVARPGALGALQPSRCDGNFGTGGGSWRSYIDYSGGGMTDWGAHHFGGATFAVDVRELEPVEVIYHDDKRRQVPDLPLPQRAAAVPQPPRHGQSAGGGHAGREAAGQARADLQGPRRHLRRLPPLRARPARSRSATSSWPHTPWPCAHLGIIAYELKRSLKWDPAKQEFPGDEEANRLLRSRPPRAVGAVINRGIPLQDRST